MEGEGSAGGSEILVVIAVGGFWPLSRSSISGVRGAVWSLVFGRTNDPNHEELLADRLPLSDFFGDSVGNGISAGGGALCIGWGGISDIVEYPSHCAVCRTSGAESVTLASIGRACNDSTEALSSKGPILVLLLIDTVSFLSSRKVLLEAFEFRRSRFRTMLWSLIYTAGGSFVAADSSGAPCSGSANTIDTLAGARRLEKDIDLQAEGEAEPDGRRPELIGWVNGFGQRNVKAGR